MDGEAREALRRFYESAHDALVSGITESVSGVLPSGALPKDELSLSCDVMLCMIEGVFLRSQVYGDADIDRLFGHLRSVIILMVRELVANSRGETTLSGPVAAISQPTHAAPER